MLTNWKDQKEYTNWVQTPCDWRERSNFIPVSYDFLSSIAKNVIINNERMFPQ